MNLLGITFMRSVYIVFDQEHDNILLAQAILNARDSFVMEIENKFDGAALTAAAWDAPGNNGLTQTPSPTPSPLPSPPVGSKGLYNYAIGGITVGSIGGVALLVTAAILFWLRKNSKVTILPEITSLPMDQKPSLPDTAHQGRLHDSESPVLSQSDMSSPISETNPHFSTGSNILIIGQSPIQRSPLELHQPVFSEGLHLNQPAELPGRFIPHALPAGRHEEVRGG